MVPRRIRCEDGEKCVGTINVLLLIALGRDTVGRNYAKHITNKFIVDIHLALLGSTISEWRCQMQARVIDSKLESRFYELMNEHKYYAAARYAYALAVSHRKRRSHLDARGWGKICLQLLRMESISLSDWEGDSTPIVLGGIEVPAPIYPDLVKKNLWWLLTTKEGKSL